MREQDRPDERGPDPRGNGSSVASETFSGCVDCVADALVSRAVAVSEAELARARKRLGEVDDATLGVLKRMVRELALRIVEGPIRKVHQIGQLQPRLAAIRTRETFDLFDRGDCPLVACRDEHAAPSDPPAANCPRRSGAGCD